MFNETWADQHARLLRSHNRLQRMLDWRTEPADPEYAELDALYHFCSDALNLRDWIVEDLPRRHGRSASKLIRRSKALAACADVANGSKHLRVTSTSYTTGTNAGHAEVVQQETRISPAPAWLSRTGAPPPPDYPTTGTTQFRLKVDAGANGTFDAVDLARQAVDDWEAWLRSRGLL
jgi:hypothetical protein